MSTVEEIRSAPARRRRRAAAAAGGDRARRPRRARRRRARRRRLVLLRRDRRRGPRGPPAGRRQLRARRRLVRQFDRRAEADRRPGRARRAAHPRRHGPAVAGRAGDRHRDADRAGRRCGGAEPRGAARQRASRAGRQGGPRAEHVDRPGAAYGVAYPDLPYPCAGGHCPAWFVPGTSAHLVRRGPRPGAAREETLRAAGPALTPGMPVLVIGYRNDPGAPRDPSGHYGYGADRVARPQSAVALATRRRARRTSSSSAPPWAATSSPRSSSTRASAPLVTGMVLDAPALDLRATVAFEAGQRTLPGLGTARSRASSPTPPSGSPAGATASTGRRRLPARRLADTCPRCVFHGTADDTVPLATSDGSRSGTQASSTAAGGGCRARPVLERRPRCLPGGTRRRSSRCVTAPAPGGCR